MSEEEKEALKSVKYQLENDYIDISGGYPNELEFNIVKKAVEFYENVKLSGKYQELEKENKELKLKYYFITGLRAGKTLMDQNIERAREFEILTKMVDEMAGEIAYLNYETIGDWCKGDQCKKFKMKENHQRECDTNNHDCIKQYFREKVRNEKWNQ